MDVQAEAMIVLQRQRHSDGDAEAPEVLAAEEAEATASVLRAAAEA